MSLGNHAAKLSFSVDVACAFLQAVGVQPIYKVIRRRGKVYQLWADKRTSRKIISCTTLEQMDLVTFVKWLVGRYHYAKILFPDPSVFARESRRGDEWMSV